MKYVLTYTFCLLCLSSFSQTKKDTEDWLTHYLNKYFYYEDESTYPYPSNSYEYTTRQFFFRGKNLVAIAETFQFSEGKRDSLVKKYVETVDLSKVIKITFSKDNDSIIYITLDCAQTGPQSNYGVIKSNVLNPADDTGAFNNSYILYSKFTDAKALTPRIDKAIHHLVLLNNGKLLKEVF